MVGARIASLPINRQRISLPWPQFGQVVRSNTGERLQHFLPGFGLARGIKLLVFEVHHWPGVLLG